MQICAEKKNEYNNVNVRTLTHLQDTTFWAVKQVKKIMTKITITECT